MKPFFNNKGVFRDKITLIEGEDIISDSTAVAERLNTFFGNAVSSLDIASTYKYNIDSNATVDPINAIINAYSEHPSIAKINETVQKATFIFMQPTLEDVKQEISCLNKNKANPSNCISTKELQEYIDICAKPLHRIINLGIEKSSFDEGMKVADITPVYKAKDKTDKSNYRPVSGLPAGSKVFERIIQKQISKYIDDYLSQYLCGYRKGYSAQQALLSLIEKW